MDARIVGECGPHAAPPAHTGATPAGAVESDIELIRTTMNDRSGAHGFGSPFANSGRDASPKSMKAETKAVAERVGLLAAGDGRSSCASLRTAAATPRRPKIAPRFLSNRWVRPHTLHLLKIKRPAMGPFYFQWRRGWDSNPRAGITRPSDFESAPL
jgi:hypothetical protein